MDPEILALPLTHTHTRTRQAMSNHHRANAFEPTLSSGVWEGLSYRQGCEGLDETRWTQTSLVFTDIRKGGRLTPRGEAPAWGREEPGSAIFRLCGKGISHWRGRQIHFALRGFVEPGGGADQHLRITLIKRHNGSFHNIVHYRGQTCLLHHKNMLPPNCVSRIEGYLWSGRRFASVDLALSWDKSRCKRRGKSVAQARKGYPPPMYRKKKSDQKNWLSVFRSSPSNQAVH